MKKSSIQGTFFQALSLLITIGVQSQNNPPQLGKDTDPRSDQSHDTERKKQSWLYCKGLNIAGVFKATKMILPDKIAGISGHTAAIPRLGIHFQLSNEYHRYSRTFYRY